MSKENIYAIRVTETLARTIAVKAESLDKAIELVEDAYHNEEIVLDYNDYYESNIGTSPYYGDDGIMTEENATYYQKLNFKEEDK